MYAHTSLFTLSYLSMHKKIYINNCFIPDIIEIKLRGRVYSNFHTRS